MLPIPSQMSVTKCPSLPCFFQFLIFSILIPVNVPKTVCLSGGLGRSFCCNDSYQTSLHTISPSEELRHCWVSFLPSQHPPSISPSLLISFHTGLPRSGYTIDTMLGTLTTLFAFPSLRYPMASQWLAVRDCVPCTPHSYGHLGFHRSFSFTVAQTS